jgi:phosphoribosylamine---glycine ligase
MKILVVGSGGREHALVQALKSIVSDHELLCAPGNAGIARDARLLDVAADDVDGIVAAVEREGIHFTVVGPEAPLVAGLVDALDARGRLVFGPSAAAARLEGSKAFAKQAMDEAGVPTARWRHVHSLEEGIETVRELTGASGSPGAGVVVKADGLAAGKGVTVADSPEQAQAALREIFAKNRSVSSDPGGPSAIVEERLVGTELSLMALCDGHLAAALPPARDYKRILDGDRGPNTGGMGAYAPVTGLGEDEIWDIVCAVHLPIVELMHRRGTPFNGILYAGLMLTAEGPRVLEFNVRFGDPEAQAVLPLLETDLLDMLVRASRSGGLSDGADPEWLRMDVRQSAVTVVLASAGYPAQPSAGAPINGLDRLPEDILVTHAGTAAAADGLVTAGGRVLNITARKYDLESAREAAYAAARMISFEGMQMRSDIAATPPPEHG